MTIEELIAANTAAVKANTEALLAALAASGKTAPAAAPVAEAPAKPAAKKAAKQAPAAAPVEPDPEPAAAEEPETPTRVDVAAKPAAETPSVAGRLPDADYPDAEEHVDVDEVIGQIQAIVKQKIVGAADPDAVKAKWFKIRDGFGVEKIGDLKGEPAKLLAALKAAKGL